MGEEFQKTAEFKRLVTLKKQRPSYARMISWEFSNVSHDPDNQRKRRNKFKRKSSTETKDNKEEEEGEEDNRGPRSDREGEVGQFEFGDSTESSDTSSEDNEYHSTVEDDVGGSNVFGNTSNPDVGSVEDRFQDSEAIRPSKQTELPENYGNLQPGRRRRPSKKQKRKRSRRQRIIYANEFWCIGNVLDLDFGEGEEMVPAKKTESDVTTSLVERHVPKLSELCLRASNKAGQGQIGMSSSELPPGLREPVGAWTSNQSVVDKQLTWLLNSLLPAFEEIRSYDNYDDSDDDDTDDYALQFMSIWGTNNITAITYRVEAWSFHLYGNMQYRHRSHLIKEFSKESKPDILIAISALATTIDLMMLGVISERSFHRRGSQSSLVDRAIQSKTSYIRNALKLRFPRLVELHFDHALPYVMWARGNIENAAQLFLALVQKEERKQMRSMYLSEIARMYNHHHEWEEARKCYRQALDVAMESTSTVIRDRAAEQQQVWLAMQYDQGVMSAHKAYQAYSAWNGVINLPSPKLVSVMAAVESFLCYHTGHWTDTPWLEEAVRLLERVVSSQPEVRYYLSMLYALEGKTSDCLYTYRQYIISSTDPVGLNFRTILDLSYSGSPWQPVADIVKNHTGPPIQPLKVVWRTVLHSPRLSPDKLTVEADLRGESLNLRLDKNGLLTGDMQMVLPPIRNVSLDPYTGKQTITQTPANTATWQSILNEKVHFLDKHFLPTLQELFSGPDGTQLHLLNTGISSKIIPVHEQYDVSNLQQNLMWLYYKTGNGLRAKKNLMPLLREAVISHIREKIEDSKDYNKGMYDIDQLYEALQNCIDRNIQVLSFKLITKCYKKPSMEARRSNHCYRSKKAQSDQGYVIPDCHVDIQVQNFFTVGKTVVLLVKYDTLFAVFINCESQQTFDCMTVQKVEELLDDSTESAEIYRSQCNVSDNFIVLPGDFDMYVYHQEGTLVMQHDIHTQTQCGDRDQGHWWSAILEPFVFLACQHGTCIRKFLISQGSGREGEYGAEDPNCFWPLVSLDVPLSPHHTCKIKNMSAAKNLLMVHFSTGVCFLSPETLEPVQITSDKKNSLTFNSDRTVFLGQFELVSILDQKDVTKDGQSRTRVTMRLDYHLAILDIYAETEQSSLGISVHLTVALPGYPVEVCHIGKKVGFLVSFTQNATRENQFYREHVYYFSYSGTLCGVLLCLGAGPRSFFPVYLSGDSESGRSQEQTSPGWYVYLRDGHNGIMAVRLQ